jgi:hypothetical protein
MAAPFIFCISYYSRSSLIIDGTGYYIRTTTYNSYYRYLPQLFQLMWQPPARQPASQPADQMKDMMYIINSRHLDNSMRPPLVVVVLLVLLLVSQFQYFFCWPWDSHYKSILLPADEEIMGSLWCHVSWRCVLSICQKCTPSLLWSFCGL